MQSIGDLCGVTHKTWFVLLAGVTTVLTVCLVYVGYVRLFERRKTVELSHQRAFREFAAGAGIGAGLISLTTACLWLGGFYHVVGIGEIPPVQTLIGMGLFAGFFEEIVTRGIIFRITEESLGTWLAIAISAFLFGFAHILNPESSWFAASCIAVEAGITLAAGYILTRRLWLPIGMHFAWNLTQGPVFGIPVSGLAVNGLLVSTLTGPELLSGGAFGAEDSIFTVIICTSAAIFMLVHSARKGQIVRPFWVRRKAQQATPALDDSIAASLGADPLNVAIPPPSPPP